MREVRISDCTMIVFHAVASDCTECGKHRSIKAFVVRQDPEKPAGEGLLATLEKLFSDIEYIYAVKADNGGVVVKFAMDYADDAIHRALVTMADRVEQMVGKLTGSELSELVAA